MKPSQSRHETTQTKTISYWVTWPNQHQFIHWPASRPQRACYGEQSLCRGIQKPSKPRIFVLLVTDVSTNWAEIIFRVKWIVFVSRWCYKSGPLKAIGQFSHDGILVEDSSKVCHRSLVSFDPSSVVGQIKTVHFVRLSDFVFVVDKWVICKVAGSCYNLLCIVTLVLLY